MSPEYKDAVLRSYKEKVAENKLSANLVTPSPANLRNECAAICRERFQRKGEIALRDFFGHHTDPKAYEEAILQSDIDKFRPLTNFLKGNTGDPNPKIVALLAWLIDFEDRPYRPDGRYGQQKTELPLPPPVKPAGLRKTGKLNRRIIGILAGMIVMATGTGVYWHLHNNKTYYSTSMPTGNEKCMFWTGDHYQPVSCDEKIEGMPVIQLDSSKVNHFKRITNKDTITYNAKGFVWYVTYKGKIDFFTSDGFHPIYNQLRLKPVTNYIIDKYVISQLP